MVWLVCGSVCVIVLGVGCGMAGVGECTCDCVGGGVWYGWCVGVYV